MPKAGMPARLDWLVRIPTACQGAFPRVVRLRELSRGIFGIGVNLNGFRRAFSPLKVGLRRRYIGRMDPWTAVVSLLAAIIGGWIAGHYAIKAQKQAAKDQRQRDLQTEQRTLNNILRSIAAELSVLKTSNFDELEKKIKQQSENRKQAQKNNLNPPPPLAMKLTEQNYFIVFESNAAALGRIDDKSLREDIINVYGHAKGLVDHLNAIGRDFQIWRHLSDTDLRKQVVASMLAGLEDDSSTV